MRKSKILDFVKRKNINNSKACTNNCQHLILISQFFKMLKQNFKKVKIGEIDISSLVFY
jgi:hypothetical protein